MRELKFRAWCNSDKVIVTNFNSPIMFNGELQYSKLFIVMQYTGLKDRNGKEMYEGDVVRTQRTDSKADIKQVHFLDGVFGLYFGNYLEALRNFYMVQVVGNIYENPELLEGNNNV